ncbi:FAD-dependent oxidoreductase [Methylibium rhizosphaerae]|uniref:FAD-dependent oxidoreductase n=1 Tax=Methylibium rhizosphaerae TaxID=2570323 RepID=UPI001128AF69|nr:FAD-dependent oxidoreductase [Methylibium rhizosphaerae]
MKPLELPAAVTGAQVQALEFAYERSPDQGAAQPVRHAVVVVGAGPVGLSLAIDLAQRGQKVLLLDNDNRLSTGSRAICFAKRTLEIWDRLGVGDRMVAKGVGWNVGKVFFRDELLYRFDLLPEEGHERPAFINLQQYYAEAYLVERASALPNLEIRWKNNVVALEQGERGTRLGIDTPDGRYELLADWVVACDGSRSPLRALVGEASHGRVFKDRFLIADVRMEAPPRALGGPRTGEGASVGHDAPAAERWFWFDPPFHRNQSVLLHMQPDGVWRIDFQLGWDADPEEEKKPGNIIPRVKALLGDDAKFELEWASVYTFACQRMDRFRLGRVLFAGDSAHGVSPFGARGANSGVQDAENLAWKLDLVLRGDAPDALLDSYASEREYAADENIRNSTRATDFITPKSEVSRLFRDAVLDLARQHPFARKLVNSGRLSVPATLHDSSLNTPDTDSFEGAMVPGAPAADAPLSIDGRRTWLLRELAQGFTLLVWDALPAWADGLPLKRLVLSPAQDPQGCLARRYDLQPGTAYLLRPDQHVCARWRQPAEAVVRAALARACALPPP